MLNHGTWFKSLAIFFNWTIGNLQYCVSCWYPAEWCDSIYVYACIYTCVYICVVMVLVAQLCPTLCDPVDCSPPGTSLCGILQAGILKWVAIPFSRGSFWPEDWLCVSCLAGRFFTFWATRGACLCVFLFHLGYFLYSSIYLSIPYSCFVPLPISPTMTVNLFSVSVE